jgi:ribosomal protein L37AE/L43A
MKGWVYIISNPAMPGLIKVGHSTKDPELRARELNHTGSPHSYIVEYEMLIEEPFRVEQQVHKALVSCREGKEWFRCLAEEAVAVVQRVTEGKAINETFKRVERERAERIRRERVEAERILKGQEDAKSRQSRVNALILKQVEKIKLEHRDRNIASELFRKFPFSLYWKIGGVAAAVIIAAVDGVIIASFPQTSGFVLLLLSVIGSVILVYYLHDYVGTRIKHSNEYKVLIQERESKVEDARKVIVFFCPQCRQALRFDVQRLLSSGNDIWNCSKCKAPVDPLQKELAL